MYTFFNFSPANISAWSSEPAFYTKAKKKKNQNHQPKKASNQQKQNQ